MIKRLLLGSALAGLLSAVPALADGLFPGLPIEGGASYCAGFSVQGTQCSATVPAGVASPTGTEYFPADLYGLSQTTNSQGLPQTNGVAGAALGFGPQVVVTTGTSLTIPNNTPNYVDNETAPTGAVTITLPATPIPWQIQRISVTNGTGAGGSVVVAANAGQSCVPSSNCGFSLGASAAAAYPAWQWNPTNSTWYRIQ